MSPTANEATPSESSSSRVLKFKRSSIINDTDRDYGLLSINRHKAKTPYPQRSSSIDADTLIKRLTSVRLFEEPVADSAAHSAAQDSLQQLVRPKKLNFTSPPLKERSGSEKHYIDTPHPIKLPRLQNFRAPKKVNNNASDAKSMSAQSSESDCLQFATPHPKKAVVLKASKLIKRLTEVMMETNSNTIKSVYLVDPCHSTTGISAREREERWQEFDRRRREFHLAEFTIAKKGKKLSDVQSAVTNDRHGSMHDPNEEEITAEFVKQLKQEGIPNMFGDIVSDINPYKYAVKKLHSRLRQFSDSSEYLSNSNTKSSRSLINPDLNISRI